MAVPVQPWQCHCSWIGKIDSKLFYIDFSFLAASQFFASNVTPYPKSHDFLPCVSLFTSGMNLDEMLKFLYWSQHIPRITTQPLKAN